MKKLIIIIQIVTIFVLVSLLCSNNLEGSSKKDPFYYMTSTGYSRNCIGEKWDDGFTATMTPVREGVCAINVDKIDDKWVVRSPLKIGQKIYIEGMGEYSVEDTGPFTETNLHFDFWNLDIFYEDDEQAKKHGVERIKVTVLKESK